MSSLGMVRKVARMWVLEGGVRGNPLGELGTLLLQLGLGVVVISVDWG